MNDTGDDRVDRAVRELAAALLTQGRRLATVGVETRHPTPDHAIETSGGAVRVEHVSGDGRRWVEVVLAKVARTQPLKRGDQALRHGNVLEAREGAVRIEWAEDAAADVEGPEQQWLAAKAVEHSTAVESVARLQLHLQTAFAGT